MCMPIAYIEKGTTMHKDDSGIEYLNYTEAAKELGVSQPSVTYMVAQGKLTNYKLGYRGQKFVKRSDVENLKQISPIHEEYVDIRDLTLKLVRYITKHPEIVSEILNSTPEAGRNGNASQDKLQEAGVF
jgi:excisionase family DNA binding protein